MNNTDAYERLYFRYVQLCKLSDSIVQFTRLIIIGFNVYGMWMCIG